MEASLAICLNDVSKTYSEGEVAVPVLHDISLKVKPGELVALMGPSGSGKSTLMNIIGLLDRPTTGELWLNGEAVTLNMSDALLAQLRVAKIGFVFQSFNLLPRLSALGNILMPAQYGKRAGSRERARQLLKTLGLEQRADHLPSQLSGGEKQRVAIARALINEPDIILADEPTGNLDTKSGEGVLDILIKLSKQGKTVVIITHDERVAAKCHRVVRILDGSIKKEAHGR
jgi:putative ABC transport system ATP-binding protein